MVFPNVLRTCFVRAPYVLRTCSVRAPHVLHAFVRFAHLATSTAIRFGCLEWETAQHTHRLGTIVSYHSQSYPCHPSWLYLSSMCVAFGTKTTRNHCLLPLPKLSMPPLFGYICLRCLWHSVPRRLGTIVSYHFQNYPWHPSLGISVFNVCGLR